jgi:DNA-binding MarR family transcriptional regulator
VTCQLIAIRAMPFQNGLCLFERESHLSRPSAPPAIAKLPRPRALKATPRTGSASHDATTAVETPNTSHKPLSDEFLAVLVIAIANRLTRGASKFYRDVWNIGVVEWRVMMCLDDHAGRPIGEIGEAADVDKGAVSRSVKVLIERGLIKAEIGARRMNLIRLTPSGKALLKDLNMSGRRRETRLLSAFSPDESAQLRAMLARLLKQVDVMNAPDCPERD